MDVKLVSIQRVHHHGGGLVRVTVVTTTNQKTKTKGEGDGLDTATIFCYGCCILVALRWLSIVNERHGFPGKWLKRKSIQ